MYLDLAFTLYNDEVGAYCVNDRRHLLQVVDDHIKEQRLVAGCQLSQQFVALQRCVDLLTQLCHVCKDPQSVLTSECAFIIL